jgi:hypothetical protein
MIQSDTIGFNNVPTIVLPVYGPYYRYHFEACVMSSKLFYILCFAKSYLKQLQYEYEICIYK